MFIAILNLSSDFADLAQTPEYATMVKDLESSDLLQQVDIGHRSFFDPPQRLLDRLDYVKLFPLKIHTHYDY